MYFVYHQRGESGGRKNRNNRNNGGGGDNGGSREEVNSSSGGRDSSGMDEVSRDSNEVRKFSSSFYFYSLQNI